MIIIFRLVKCKQGLIRLSLKKVSTPERNADLSAELELVFITMLTLAVSCLTLSTEPGINVNKTVGGWNTRKNETGRWTGSSLFRTEGLMLIKN